MRIRPSSRLAALILAVAAVVRCEAREIPLEDFFMPWAFDEIAISPDGSKVSALSTWKEHRNLYVIDLKTHEPRMLTGLTTQDVADVHWVGNNRLIFTTMEDGYGSGGLFAIDADGRNSTVLGPSAPQQARSRSYVFRQTSFLGSIRGSEDEILVTTNKRRELDPDVAIMNVRTGASKLVARNPGDIRHWVADHDGAVRAGFGQAGVEQFLICRDSKDGEWREVRRWDFRTGTLRPLAFDAKNERLYVATNFGRDTLAIASLDLSSGEISPELFANDTYDLDDICPAPRTHALLGYTYLGEKREVVWTERSMARLQELIDQELPETVNRIYSASADLTWIVILASSDRNPGTFYLLGTKDLSLEKLVSRADWIVPAEMAEMKPIQYKARDGMTIHGYLTLPVGKDPSRLPLVVNPHGGPWVRDEWGFNYEVQFLANRGYAVLQVNFRGSTGYGRKLLEAGYGQWGLAMQDDITDAVHWAIDQGIADPNRVAIYGASYGGYATMAGLAFTPELYRCGVNYVGVTDISLLLKTLPKGWESIRAQLESMTGDPKKDSERLEATSPLQHADNVRVPVFFAYGELDDRVDMKHGMRFADSLKDRGIPVEVMTRLDEGHGYYRMENKIAFYVAMERFLAANMAPRSAKPAAPDN